MLKQLLIVTILALFSLGTAFAHPYEQYVPNDPEHCAMFNGSPEELDGIGEVRFDYSLPSKSQLSPVECYLLAGAQNSSKSAGLQPWWELVMFTAISYEGLTGKWPSAISDEVLEVIEGDFGPSHLREELKSPLTGEYPRLDATGFSPGNLYMRRLTNHEADTLLQQGANLYSPERRSEVEERGGTLLGNPIYVRIYGEQGVLAARYLQFGSGKGG